MGTQGRRSKGCRPFPLRGEVTTEGRGGGGLRLVGAPIFELGTPRREALAVALLLARQANQARSRHLGIARADERLIAELADLWFASYVVLAARGLDPDAVEAELKRRARDADAATASR
mgnify:CR=1 FL=1